ncbi:MAG: DEAD/DEAH box helicase [Clostridiaceae bacterium]|uniref:ATP-dependent RNA helicase CshA n=1 Tax=Clostridium porci TaxID=2605778 RepID=A0A7X2NHJ3_9CLOT|nr:MULTISPECIES: DEAD/DEAH box helicase [Clostridium]MCI6140286.1 DEAD/DEAH box helicase [Clostridium sp.]MDY3231395.1 DEAD/DEAH box helicase [Clostridiaceae bacterium]MSS35029.1 DEAD/DEAH box helicase [Clostridium porci]
METVKFDELQLDERMIRAITEMGFEEASPIQAQAIPVVLEGRDIIGQAQTGTGKTAAFGLPLLQKVNPKVKKLQAIVLLPTRELAIQVAEEMRRFSKFMHGIKVLPVYGGQDIVKQIRSLKDGTQIVVGTPGRVMDHMRRKTVKVDYVHTVVLDEADEMLNMGFLEDMETILSQLPEQRQTLMFSATMPQAIADIARRFQNSPVTVRVIKKELTVPKVTQYYYEVKPKNKVEVMCRILDMYAPKLSIAFCNTKRQVDELVQALQGRGYFAEGLHGDLKQIQRDRVMNGFRNGRTEILVATDVAARGIDVGDVEAVFNYDVPQDDEYYVHRIGRTGRAGREGKAFSLVVGREVYKLRDIQRYCKTKIIPQAIPSLNDITEIKVEKILDQVAEVLEDSDLSKMVTIIEKKLLEEDYTSLDLAAALLKMAMGEDNEDIIDCSVQPRSLDELGSYGQRGRSRGCDRGGYGRSSRRGSADYGMGEETMSRLFINIGKAQRVTPGDILGAVAGESGIPGRMVGSIDMYDGYTFVDVPGRYAEAVLKAMAHAKIKGKSVHVEKANNNRR